MNKKEIHYNYCSGCIKFLTGVCCGILYHISDIAPQPLCLPVKEQLAKTDRDTWKRACELASETLKQVMGKPLWIGGNIPTPEVKDSDYFYQQAKKGGRK